MSKKRVVLVWFRNDLRLHDNEVLSEAVHKADVVIPVYCFDPRYYSNNQYGNKNTGVLRAQFILECVQNLKDNLTAIQSDLMTFVGLPEEILPRLVAKYEVDEVYHHREVAFRETSISEKVEAAIWQSNRINLRHFIGHTLYHKEDLPFPIRDIPESFSLFRKKIERESTVRPPIASITQIISPQHLEKTKMPTLDDLGYSSLEQATLPHKALQGGEDQALHKMETVIAPTFQGLYDFSLISPYLAHGTLSPSVFYHKLVEGNTLNKNNKSYERRISRLLWRDYFRFMLKKYPNIYFRERGFAKQPIDSTSYGNEDPQFFFNGNTGVHFIDQSIEVLKATGNLPSNIRTILALYFIQETGKSWLEGASFFEEHLIDYSPSTTYGYWAHLAQVGTSVKDNSKISWEQALKKSFPDGSPFENIDLETSI